MSHYTVTVRLTQKEVDAARDAAEGADTTPMEVVEKALELKMAPYYENTEAPEHSEWEDETEAIAKGFEEDTLEHFREEGGYLRKPTHEDADKARLVEVPVRIVYGDVATYAKKYHGASPDPAAPGRFGHRRAKQPKWDWYVVGGRWTGYYPVRSAAARRFADVHEGYGAGARMVPGGQGAEPTKSDVVHVGEIDFDAVSKEAWKRASDFHAQYNEMLGGKQFPAFEGPRSKAMDMGLVRIVRGPLEEPLKGDEVDMPWAAMKNMGKDDERRTWHDVGRRLPIFSEFLKEHGDEFNPLITYAALDHRGWHEPGKMGWFGVNDSTPETYLSYRKSFMEQFVKACDPTDLLVVVDAHI